MRIPTPRGPEHVHTSCRPSWEGHLLLPAFEVVLGGRTAFFPPARTAHGARTHWQVTCRELWCHRPACWALHMLEKSTVAPIAAGFLFRLFVPPHPLNIIFLKKAVCVMFKRTHLCPLSFCNVRGHGRVMRSRAALPKELLEPSGTVDDAGCK